MFSLIDEQAEAEKDPVAHHLYGQQLPGHRQASGSRWFYLCIPLSCTSLIQGEKGGQSERVPFPFCERLGRSF